MISTTRRACATSKCRNIYKHRYDITINNTAVDPKSRWVDMMMTTTMTTRPMTNYRQHLLSTEFMETRKHSSLQAQQIFTFFQQQHRSMVMITETKVNKSTPSQSTNLKDKSEEQVPVVTISTTSLNETHPLTITESCWKRIHQLAMKRNQSLNDLYLRIFVDAGGCSGFTYQFEFDTTPINIDDDIIFYETTSSEQNNVNNARVVVDTTSFTYINGATINYVQEMIKSTFEVQNNPQSESACGCGSSFALKNFAKNPALH